MFLFDGPDDAPATVLLAHGAGAPMDSASMAASAQALAQAGLRVVRFEFAYMAARRDGVRKPPPRAETLVPAYRAVVAALEGQLVVVVERHADPPRDGQLIDRPPLTDSVWPVM